MSVGSHNNADALVKWDPHQFLRRIDPLEALFSCGYLRSRPEKWFPGFAAQWLPLAHSLGADIRVLEVKPGLALPDKLEDAFCASVDGQLFAVLLGEEAAAVLLEAVVPGAAVSAQMVTLEYLARRFIGSLAFSWTGSELSQAIFCPEKSAVDLDLAGAIKLVVAVNSGQVTIWIALNRNLLERLDGLWRRQVHSTSKQVLSEVEISIELVQLAVPSTALNEYLRSGQVVDLETLMTDTVTIRYCGKPWLPGRMCRVGDRFGIETVGGPVIAPTSPHGTIPLSIELGKVHLDSQRLSEISQVGAVLDTQLPLTDRVSLAVDGEQVGSAVLGGYNGHFAVTVL